MSPIQDMTTCHILIESTCNSPRLPIGGFSALTPPLTIVRKDGGDGSLFSTMTCANLYVRPFRFEVSRADLTDHL